MSDQRKTRRIAFLLVSVAVSACFSLLLIETGLGVIHPESPSPVRMMRGLFAPDPEQGHRLAAGHSMVWDDGIVRGARHTINSLGHRDREPTGDGSARVLLLGDSFTFGALLDDADTIDRAIEHASGGRFDAYNLGVPGYGAVQTRIAFERFDLPASHAVYLFYHNDLRNDAMDPTATTVHRGFLVPRLGRDGRPMDEIELDRRIESILRSPAGIGSTLRLKRLRSLVIRRPHSSEPLPGPGSLRDLEVGGGDHPLGYRFENVAFVAAEVGRMQTIARERGIRFAVLIVPGVAEAAHDEHFTIVGTLLDELRARRVEIIEPIGPLEADAYIPHDLHFNAKGAEITAQAILAWLGRAEG